MTMKTPEMEVVRLNESDVIVASGPIPVDKNFYATTSGWGGATGGASLKITQNNTVLADYSWDAIVGGEASNLINNNIYFAGKSLKELYDDEITDHPQYDNYNGNWISSNGVDYSRFQ